MVETQIDDQTIRYDRAATTAVYATIEHGDAERCGCIFCKNFAAQRDFIYPASFRALLEQLGIDPNKEGEVFEYGPVEDGCHLYGGWFYLVGELTEPSKRTPNDADSHQFAFWFTTSCPNDPPFQGGPLLAIEFMTHAKWILPDSSDWADTRADNGRTNIAPKSV